MFTLAIILCTNVQCIPTTPGQTYNTLEECKQAAADIRQEGLDLIDRGALIPHSFEYQCVQWGNKL